MSEYFVYTPLTRGSLARANDVNQRFQAIETGLARLPDSARLKEGRATFYEADGTGNALAVTMSPAISAYNLGLTINLGLTANNSGAATLNVNGVGAVGIKRSDGSALASGDLVNGQIVEVTYDGANFRLQRLTSVEVAGYVTASAASAVAAAASAIAAAGSAQAASNSAGDAAGYASAAQGSAAAAAASAGSISGSGFAHLATTETFTGAKTFSLAIGASAGITINGQTLSGLTAAGKAVAESANASAQRNALGLTIGTDVLGIGGGTLTGALSLNADPSSALHAATKQYVDAVAAGMDPKGSVLCATTANITLSGEQTIDGVATSASRVLVKDQSSASANGIYVSAAGAWARAADMDAWIEVPGAFCFVEQGTVNGDCGYVCTSNAGGTIGATAISFSQFYGPGGYTASGGITRTGVDFALTSMAQATVKGRASGAGTGAPSDLSAAQLYAILATASQAVTTSGITQSTGKILGRTTASTGAIEEIAIGSNLTLSAGTLSATGGSWTDQGTSPATGGSVVFNVSGASDFIILLEGVYFAGADHLLFSISNGGVTYATAIDAVVAPSGGSSHKYYGGLAINRRASDTGIHQFVANEINTSPSLPTSSNGSLYPWRCDGGITHVIMSCQSTTFSGGNFRLLTR